MKAVIMAGGEGSRLRPLTCTLPKPMVPILNRPMMEHIVNLLKRHGITSIVSTLWYLPQQVTDYFEDGSAFGVNMDYFIEREPLGTAGSVKNAAPTLTDTFLVVSGDALTDIDLSSAVAYHREQEALATIVLARVANPLSYGVVLTDDNGRITQFLEKPSWGEVFSDTVNTGIYILDPEVLDLVASNQKVDFSQDIFPELLRQGAPLYGYVAKGYWSDVGNLEVYRQAQQDALDRKVQLELPIAQPEQVYLEEGVQIHPTARIQGPVYIGKGCKIGPHAFIGPYSVLGPYNQIDSHANLKRSLLWSGVKVGKNSALRGCVCAKHSLIEPDSEIYEGAVLGERVRLGAMSLIAPNVKVWPEKIIPSGTQLRSTLVWGSQEQRPIFSKRGIAGDLRASLTPEVLTQLGFSFAAFLGTGSQVLITSDHSQVADLAKRALVVGLLGGGADTHDGGEVAGRLTRFAVQTLKLDGALHVATSSQNENEVVIECWNAQGLPFSKAEQRKLQDIFSREDYPRFGGDDLGAYLRVAGLQKRYLHTLAKHYANKRPGFQVGLVVNTPKDPLGEMIRDFLRLSGYAVVEEQPEGIPTIVVQEQDWFLQDNKGTRLSEHDWWKIFIEALKVRQKEAVALPVHLSQKVEETAQKRGLNVRFTKLEPRYWMEAATELGLSVSRDEGEFFPVIEPLASIGEILTVLSSERAVLPGGEEATHLKTAKVLCSWDNKGRVMRKLMENADPSRTLYFNGIKEQLGSGWVLAIPDDDEPVFRLYSEAETEAEATELIQYYTDLIRRFEREENS